MTLGLTWSGADMAALYRNIERAELDVAGTNIKERRSAVFMTAALSNNYNNYNNNDDDDSNDVGRRRDDTWRHLLSLSRTLKVIFAAGAGNNPLPSVLACRNFFKLQNSGLKISIFGDKGAGGLEV